ncbi:class I SAM-dependent methyltransferase [Rhizobium mongolense]|uniref:class I SAM-dependent methyltransferase n=1 Tax=Rhizobium mongolense TaxID=57676 RepID=UPI0035587F96
MRLDDFGSVGDAYQRYSAGIRGKIRHELVFEVVAGLTSAGGTVLDMGCGDGEISARLSEAGFRVLGIDASPEMLRRANLRKAELPEQVRSRLEFALGDITDFASEHLFDAVCCHGVLMYLDDSAAAIRKLASHVKRGGLLSILTKNALSGGFRQALRGDYATARELIETGAAASIGNLGIRTRGDDPSAVVQQMGAYGEGSACFPIILTSRPLTARSQPSSSRLSALLRFVTHTVRWLGYFMRLGGKPDEIRQIPCFSNGTKSIAVEKAGFGVARKPAFAYIAATVFKFPPGAAHNGTSVHLSYGRPQQGLWQQEGAGEHPPFLLPRRQDRYPRPERRR